MEDIIKQDTTQQEAIQPQAPTGNPPKNKFNVSLVTLLIIILIVLGLIAVVQKSSKTGIVPSAREKENTDSIKTNHIITFSNSQGELDGMDFTGKIFTIIATDEIIKFCGAANCGSVRQWSISNDGTKIAVSFNSKHGIDNTYVTPIGYVDIYGTDRTIHPLAKGESPKWSPYEDEIIFEKNSGKLTLINFKTKEQKLITLPKDQNAGNYFWISKDIIGITTISTKYVNNLSPRSFATYNFSTNEFKKIPLSLSEGIDLGRVEISPLNDKFLIYSFINKGNVIGITNTDGSGYTPLNKTVPQDFAGYEDAVFSPDEKYVLVNDQELNSNKSRFFGTMRILDTKGNEITTLDAHPINYADLCWLQTPQGEFIVSSDTENAKVYNATNIHHISLFKEVPGANIVCY